MLRYFIKRILLLIPIIVAVTIVVFTLMYLVPGDPAEILLSGTATPEDVELLRETMGLNDPYFVRLGRFLSDTYIHFDFGTSYSTNQDIWTSIKDRLPRTMKLSLATMALSALFGIPLGIYAAIKQGRLGDNICMLLALVGVSIPNFWLALLLILLFSVNLGWLPALGIGGIKYYVLPALSGCVGGIATEARQTRSSMLEVIRSDYIITARSKGVSEFDVIMKHALKNAMIPIITLIGSQFGFIVGGSMITETIFSIPGMGSFIINGVNSRDYPVVQAGSIFIAAFFSFGMVLVDILYAAVDPRIKAQYTKKKRR